ncbi:MAG TPA: hypothetical protein VFZ09_51235 [Archangium sp.]|uniref:hypothetical protein n=1 Tax=Archangium sp. TaxID=1872627 RepID=UPI002E32D368|nr:hypothetical protein [Archangium sp.]HEX5754662.1 hypothetical protein [Archangium sp.]
MLWRSSPAAPMTAVARRRAPAGKRYARAEAVSRRGRLARGRTVARPSPAPA